MTAASSLAPRVDAIFWTLVIASALLVAVLAALNLTYLVRYRRGSPAARRPAVAGSEAKVEAAWILGTTLIFLGFFFWGARTYLDLERAPAGAYEIDVIGRQWMWDVRQPGGVREFNTLHVPLNQDVRLALSSEDVIHSFFVPAFRLKQDVVPGKTTSAWFRATRTGTFQIFCAQFCGTAHAAMTGQVIVMEPEAYAAWLAAEGAPASFAVRGRELFLRYNCNGCHDPPATVRAPPLGGLYGNLVPVQGGRMVRADEPYLRDSILLPAKDIVAGYAPVMPPYQGVIPEGDLLELIRYLKSLPPATAAVPLRAP